MGRPMLTFEQQYIPVTESGCWLWTGGVNPDGYGTCSRTHRGTNLAHRYSYAIHHGPIPRGMCVCHACDVPSCVNPNHLFLGSNVVNTSDKTTKGRQAKVQRISGRLTEQDVIAILACSDPCYVIANRYGVSDSAISYIKLGKTWKHVPRPEGYAYVPVRSKVNNRWINRK